FRRARLGDDFGHELSGYRTVRRTGRNCDRLWRCKPPLHFCAAVITMAAIAARGIAKVLPQEAHPAESRLGVAHHLFQTFPVAGMPLFVGAEKLSHLLRICELPDAFDLDATS